eukprot:PhM_4_TR15272/c0_g1_i1/m.30341
MGIFDNIFGRNKPEQDEEVHSLPSKVGGEFGYERSGTKRLLAQAKRSHFEDNDMSHLLNKYSKEFETAEKRIESRDPKSWLTSLKYRFWYDYDDDRVFAVWQKDKEVSRERAKVHWVDDHMDDFWYFIRHALRVGTSAGLIYGVGRGLYLWRSIDRVYTRLHGVGFFNVVGYEAAVAVMWGSAYTAIWCAGVYSGEIAFKLFYCLYSGSVQRRRRDGHSLMAGGVTGGVLMPIPFLYYGTVAPMYKLAVWVLSAASSAYLGHVVGHKIYDPWIQAYGAYDDRSWVPWYKKSLAREGPCNIRGRYI